MPLPLLAGYIGWEHAALTDKIPAQSRYFVRMGGKGWMVYDRERKGPALIGSYWAVSLTKERAEQILHSLTSSSAE